MVHCRDGLPSHFSTLCYFLLTCVSDARNENDHKSNLFAACICVIPAVLSYLHIIGFQHYLLLFGRPKGLFKDPNVLKPYLIPPALFALAGLVWENRCFRGTCLHGFCLVVTTGGILLSFSRACWINYFVCVVMYMGLRWALKRVDFPFILPTRRLLLGGMLGLAAVLILLQLPQVRPMLKERITSNGLHGYDEDRFRTQRLALESAYSRPLGIGPGQSEEAFQYATHSSYMRVLSENGILGFIAYGGFVLLSFSRALVLASRTENLFWKRIYLVAAACIAGHIINSAVVDTVHWRHYWFLLALPWYDVSPLHTDEPQQNATALLLRDQAGAFL